jgi:hypothetical protein
VIRIHDTLYQELVYFKDYLEVIRSHDAQEPPKYGFNELERGPRPGINFHVLTSDDRSIRKI